MPPIQVKMVDEFFLKNDDAFIHLQICVRSDLRQLFLRIQLVNFAKEKKEKRIALYMKDDDIYLRLICQSFDSASTPD